MIIDKFEE
jgi:hypothetical protein